MATSIETTKTTSINHGQKDHPKRYDFLKVHNEGSCKCGAVKIRTYTDPIIVVNCHCSKCRAFNPSKPYNSTTLYWKFAVDIIIATETENDDDGGGIDFVETTAQFNTVGLLRGRCSKCKEPVIDVGNVGLLKLFTCPSASLLELQPTANMYYGSGLQEDTMGLTTYDTDFITNLFIIPQMLYKSFPQLIWYALNIIWETLTAAAAFFSNENNENDKEKKSN